MAVPVESLLTSGRYSSVTEGLPTARPEGEAALSHLARSALVSTSSLFFSASTGQSLSTSLAPECYLIA